MSQQIFHLQPWSPRTNDIAQEIIRKIHSAAPELEVLFMGAAALGLPGKNDIDLDILCSQADVLEYTKLLTPILGQPKDTSDTMTVWYFKVEDFEIDMILSDPKVSHVPEQRAVFEKLQSNPNLLDAYRKLKESCDGLPYGEYEKRKKIFFKEKVLS